MWLNFVSQLNYENCLIMYLNIAIEAHPSIFLGRNTHTSYTWRALEAFDGTTHETSLRIIIDIIFRFPRSSFSILPSLFLNSNERFLLILCFIHSFNNHVYVLAHSKSTQQYLIYKMKRDKLVWLNRIIHAWKIARREISLLLFSISETKRARGVFIWILNNERHSAIQFLRLLSSLWLIKGELYYPFLPFLCHALYILIRYSIY